MIILVGEGGSGKDAIFNMFKKKGFDVAVEYTTRIPRHNEVNGIDYHFIGDLDFLIKRNEGFFAGTFEVDGRDWRYGTAKEDCKDDVVLITNPTCAREIKETIENVTIIYIRAEEEVRKERMFARGDNPDEINRRLKTDRADFKHFKKNADFEFYNNGNSYSQLEWEVAFFIDEVLYPYLDSRRNVRG